MTSDSVSMISEALATTASVLVFQLPGSPRHLRFVDNLIAKSLVAPLNVVQRPRRRAVVDATPDVVEAVRRLL